MLSKFQIEKLLARKRKVDRRFATIKQGARERQQPVTGMAAPLAGRRRVLLPLQGSERARALMQVERESYGLQGLAEAHVRAERVGRFLRLRHQDRLLRHFEPCFATARRLLRASVPAYRATDCLIGESAACSFCQLEAQLAIRTWADREPRLQDGLAVTIARPEWRRRQAELRFDLEAAKREVRDVLNMCGARVYVFGRFEFSLGTEPGMLPCWEPHLHLTITGPDAAKVVDALAAELPGLRVVLAKEVTSPEWTTYTHKGVGTRRDGYVSADGKSRRHTKALDRSSELELFRYLYKKTIYDLIFRWGIDIPRDMMDTVTLRPVRRGKSG